MGNELGAGNPLRAKRAAYTPLGLICMCIQLTISNINLVMANLKEHFAVGIGRGENRPWQWTSYSLNGGLINSSALPQTLFTPHPAGLHSLFEGFLIGRRLYTWTKQVTTNMMWCLFLLISCLFCGNQCGTVGRKE